jgi:hypothetical protein
VNIISNFHDDFAEIILNRVEYLKNKGFKFIEYDVWKKVYLKKIFHILNTERILYIIITNCSIKFQQEFPEKFINAPTFSVRQN